MIDMQMRARDGQRGVFACDAQAFAQRVLRSHDIAKVYLQRTQIAVIGHLPLPFDVVAIGGVDRAGAVEVAQRRGQIAKSVLAVTEHLQHGHETWRLQSECGLTDGQRTRCRVMRFDGLTTVIKQRGQLIQRREVMSL